MVSMSSLTPARRMGLLLFALASLFSLALTPRAQAQDQGADYPTAFEPMPPLPADQATTGATQTEHIGLAAACWYLPNRLMDLTDIPRIYITVGDGIGFNLRATKYLYASYYQTNTYGLGWTRRTQPFFGEDIDESYFGFFAAHEGEMDRDPTEIGLSGHFIFLGLNLAASTGEFADFLAGFAGIDLNGDDHGPFMNDEVPPPGPEIQRLQQAVYGPQQYTTEGYQSPSKEIGPPAPAAPPATAPAAPAPSNTLPPPIIFAR